MYVLIHVITVLHNGPGVLMELRSRHLRCESQNAECSVVGYRYIIWYIIHMYYLQLPLALIITFI